jgi:hypothetical protein
VLSLEVAGNSGGGVAQPAAMTQHALPVPSTTADFHPRRNTVWPRPAAPAGSGATVVTPTTFENVIPDTDLTFTIDAFNDFTPQIETPQVFEATIRVLADGCHDLDERSVFILVPPAPLVAPR